MPIRMSGVYEILHAGYFFIQKIKSTERFFCFSCLIRKIEDYEVEEIIE